MSYQHNDRNVRTSRGDNISNWLPLMLTVSAAAIGIAAWIWSERSDDDELPPRSPEDNTHQRSRNGSRNDSNFIDHFESPKSFGNESPTSQSTPLESQSYMARMSGALRRTPSPQQIFDGASRSIVEGITAAGVVVGTALGSIIEEDKNAYKDHETWSEEADALAANRNLAEPLSDNQNQNHSAKVSRVTATSTNSIKNGKRKTIAIVISADSHCNLDLGTEELHEHALITSYLPHNTDFSKIRLFILIHSPQINVHPLDSTSAHSAIQGFPILQSGQGHVSGEFENDKYDTLCISIQVTNNLSSSSTIKLFDTVYSQALQLVEKKTMVLPFNSATGHVQILRHLNPDIVYLQESLSGANGELITYLQTWLRQDIVLMIGNSGVSGASIDSDGETKDTWWKRPDRVGKGRGVAVIEVSRVGDDWNKRVENNQ